MTFTVIVTGSRNYRPSVNVYSALRLQQIRHGSELYVKVGDCYSGVDFFTQAWCESNLDNWEKFDADWKKYGKAAGPIRNHRMVDSGADLVLAFPETFSKGTKDCAEYAVSKGIPVRFPDLPEWAQWAAPIAQYNTDRTGEIHD